MYVVKIAAWMSRGGSSAGADEEMILWNDRGDDRRTVVHDGDAHGGPRTARVRRRSERKASEASRKRSDARATEDEDFARARDREIRDQGVRARLSGPAVLASACPPLGRTRLLKLRGAGGAYGGLTRPSRRGHGSTPMIEDDEVVHLLHTHGGKFPRLRLDVQELARESQRAPRARQRPDRALDQTETGTDWKSSPEIFSSSCTR